MAGHLQRTIASRTRTGVWVLTVAPTIWALHLLTSYVVAAVYCAKFTAAADDVAALRWTVYALSAVALTGIAASAVWGYRQLHTRAAASSAGDSAPGRQRFLGLATVLLSALSAVATGYTTLVFVMIRSCD